ncbi:hypothetical protein [Synoicihabitans lomoniglobus]|uniref:Transglutaminase-like domain-containing protein n=1 Tax=Synoicihabitans lomoniglobus TaxID=2909285 RepID=A0AAF0CPA4_9BACT|nr:hypothetical protein [Opitutaceae bacterium LMO-M01]WED65750.1 hypothetical protein PXH66_02680 [Opitutaceae bacterium LMO-M01]
MLPCIFGLSSASGVTLPELEHLPKLTPKKFAAKFADFDYRYYREVQPAEVFLRDKVGDCDDYAVLADYILPLRGYETRLIHVRLAGRIAHAVCYVTEDNAYLDYNNRSVFFRLTKSRPTLRAIAEKVADSLDANWTTASEFSYSYESDRKTILATVARNAPPEDDPPIGRANSPQKSLRVD